MPYTGEEKAYLWLSACELDAALFWRWMATYHSALAIYEAFERPDFPREGDRRLLTKYHDPGELSRYIERLNKRRIFVLFPHSECYPELLRFLPDKPYVLYCAGDMEAALHSCVSIVGTRAPSDYGRRMARMLASDMAQEGITVVSGMATGIDAEAHLGALNAGGLTVAVLGSGLNVPYPASNEPLYRRLLTEGGLAMTELPLDSQPRKYHFPRRNRIISGLSHALVFVEGRIKSGGMVTVGLALTQGRDVFAVPGQAGLSVTEGTHLILREGARMATCGADIMEDVGHLLTKRRKRPKARDAVSAEEPTQTQLILLRALHQEAADATVLCLKTGLPDETVQVELAMLDIAGLVTREAGNRYALTHSAERFLREE